MRDEPLAREREPIERVRPRLEALIMANAAPPISLAPRPAGLGTTGRDLPRRNRVGFLARVMTNSPHAPANIIPRHDQLTPRPANIIPQQINVRVAIWYRAGCAIGKFGTVNRNCGW
jgi:hypothetical protein